jgi:superfamily II DNA or RNA helicase
MRLFPDWEGIITLPPSPLRKNKVGKNFVSQQAFRGISTSAKMESSEERGYYTVRTSLTYPYNEFLLKLKGVRNVDSNLLVLAAPNTSKLHEINSETLLKWGNSSLLDREFFMPDQILESWNDKFAFRVEDNVRGIKGLRPPQIGALHALAAHFSVGKDFEPVTVVLPTGTGKTETMLSFQVYNKPQRTLVIVSNDELRNQIYTKYLRLGVLSEIGVIPIETIGPKVAKVKAGLKSEDEAKSLIDESNIIVTLPQSLSASTPEALNILVENCSDLIVDEAHHITSPQWAQIKQMFTGKRIIQFTATPFRRDNKRIDGKIIFNYKLGDAQAAGYYRQIKLKEIVEFGDEYEHDLKIAEAAVAVLRHDRETLNLDHILMARCEKKERAEKVFEIYQELAPEMFPQLIYSGSGSKTKNSEAINRLVNRDENAAHIVVCVNMLGEGFDLPNLKIAALHETHKSLAITLQFIGRFTRKGNWEEIGEASVIANVADPDTEKRIEALYAEGADWDGLIRRFSEERIDQEIQLQNVINSLREKGDLHSFVSLWNLRPAFSMQIFKTQCVEWAPENYVDILSRDSKWWHSISHENDILVAVVHSSMRVRWGNYQSINDHNYYLLIARWDRSSSALFIYSSNSSVLRGTELAKAITDESTILLNGPAVFNILNNVEFPLVKNLGSSRKGAISFTSYFGPNVTEGLALIERAESTLNNIACVGYENGDRVLWGGTQKRGKIWQQTSGTIAQWIEWTKQTWEKVSDDSYDDISNVISDFLRPEKLDKPYSEYPISVQWGEQIYHTISDLNIVFGSIEIPLYLIDLQISEVKETGEIIIQISSDSFSSEYSFYIGGNNTAGYFYSKVSGEDVYLKKANSTKIEICEYFVIDPVIVRYTDGTYSYNCYHIPIKIDSGEFPIKHVEVLDFGSTPLNRESMGKRGNTNTIQHRSFIAVSDEYDIVFNDDGKGEAGDLVCLKNIDESSIKLCIIHCKGAFNNKISNDIRNFYTVCGQAQKSISVKHLGMARLYKNLKRRQGFWSNEGYSRFLKGDMRKLSYFNEKARRSKIEFEVIIVQPGGSKAKLSSDILKLLGTTEHYIKTTTQGEFRVIVSP